MRISLLNILLCFLSLHCVSQTLIPNLEIVKTYGTEHLLDCQVLNKAPNAWRCADTSVLYNSYEFDNYGKIIKKIKANNPDTALTIYTYNELGKIGSMLHFSRNYKDTMLQIFYYNSKGNVDKRLDYSIRNGNRMDNRSELLNFYNKRDSLEKKVYLDYSPSKKKFDTTYYQIRTYNSQGMKETETIYKYVNYNSFEGEQGFSTFKYDITGRLIEKDHIGFRGMWNKDSSPSDNYKCLYSYIGDSVISETSFSESNFLKETIYRNAEKKIIKIERNSVQLTKIKNINGVYCPDLNGKTARIQNEQTTYFYDKLGRITKSLNIFNNEYKSDGLKSNGETYEIYLYRDDIPNILPEEEYFYKWGAF